MSDILFILKIKPYDENWYNSNTLFITKGKKIQKSDTYIYKY